MHSWNLSLPQCTFECIVSEYDSQFRSNEDHAGSDYFRLLSLEVGRAASFDETLVTKCYLIPFSK